MVYVWLALQFLGQRPTRKDVGRMERFGHRIADVIETISVQFNKFYLAKINYNTRIHNYKNSKLAREPRRNKKAYEDLAPQSQRNK